MKKEKKPGFFIRSAEKLNNAYEKSLEKNDPIYLEPLHKKEESEGRVLKCGSIDVYFLLIVIALASFGAVMSYSASFYTAEAETGDSLYYITRHIGYILLAVVGTIPFVILARPSFWKMFAMAAYIGAIILLLAVLVVGTEGGGANRWIQIGPITLQPSEIAKVAVVMFLALIMSKYEKKIELSQRFGGHFKYGVFYPVLVIGSLCGLVMLEKHLSGLIIIGLLGLTIMFLGGADKKWMLAICVAGIFAVLVVLLFSDYAQERVMTWLFI